LSSYSQVSIGCMNVKHVQSQYISDFTLFVDLLLQMLEDVRIDVSGGTWLSHGGVHHVCKTR
jgi:hypothetical protein